MQEIDRRTASLKLRLAEIEARQRSLGLLRRQFQQQLDRTMDVAIWAEHSLELALGTAGEIEARLAETETALKHLGALQARAREELQTLLLTKRVDEAKQQIAALERERRDHDEARHRHGASPVLDARMAAIERELAALRQLIDDSSAEAARRLLGA